MSTNLKGIYPAVVTPLTVDGEFMPEAFAALCERLYQSEIDGLYVCGQTGEGLAMSPDQRKATLEGAISATPSGKQIIAHVGAANTGTALELAKHAEKAGAHALSSLPPTGAYSMDEVYGYYKDLASATDLPFLVYFFPNHALNPKTLQDLLKLCEIPNVVGMKFTSTDLYTLGELKKTGVTVFNGFDEMLVAGLLMGADGGIGSFYNVAPQWFVDLYRSARSGDWLAARNMQSKINQLITLGLRHHAHVAVKEMLRWQGLDCGVCLSPRKRLSDAEVEQLHRDMDVPEFASLRA